MRRLEAPTGMSSDTSRANVARLGVFSSEALCRREDEDGDATSTQRWRKGLGFVIGMAIPIGVYVLVAPHLATWNAWASTHLTRLPSSSRVIAGAAAATESATTVTTTASKPSDIPGSSPLSGAK